MDSDDEILKDLLSEASQSINSQESQYKHDRLSMTIGPHPIDFQYQEFNTFENPKSFTSSVLQKDVKKQFSNETIKLPKLKKSVEELLHIDNDFESENIMDQCSATKETEEESCFSEDQKNSSSTYDFEDSEPSSITEGMCIKSKIDDHRRNTTKNVSNEYDIYIEHKSINPPPLVQNVDSNYSKSFEENKIENDFKPVPMSSSSSFTSSSPKVEQCEERAFDSPIDDEELEKQLGPFTLNENASVPHNTPFSSNAELPRSTSKEMNLSSLQLNKLPQEEVVEEETDMIPPRIKEMVTQKPGSVFYIALSGMSIMGYSNKTIDKVLIDLRTYLSRCIEAGFIGEAQYLENCVNQVKSDRDEMKNSTDIKLIYEAEDQLEEVKSELDQKKYYYQNCEAKLLAERDMAMNDLKIKLDEDLDRIDEEWTSPGKIEKFNKPSAKIFDMKRHAKLLLKTHRYDEAAMLSKSIEELEVQEAYEASRRMKLEYSKALQKRQAKFETDQNSLELVYKSKLIYLRKEAEKHTLPLERRYNKVVKKKQELEKSPSTKTRSPPRQYGFKNAVISQSKTLTIPPLSKIKRKSFSRSITNSSPGIRSSPKKSANPSRASPIRKPFY